MAHSPLATVNVPAHSGNYTRGRAVSPRAITLHHMAGVNTAEGCGNIFATPGRNGSAHYGIGNDGTIAWYVDEADTAWTNSNWPSNCESITIETSNNSLGGDWTVSDEALASLVKLVADIANRNNLGTLVPGQNLTWHSMFTATTCPGNYLRSIVEYIAEEANKINNASPEPAPTPAPAPEPTNSHNGISAGDKVIPKSYVDYNGVRLLKTRDFYFVSNISGNRAVINADSVSGPIYCAMVTDNLDKVGGSAPTPAPVPVSNGIAVGDKVVPKFFVDYNGTKLVKTRDFYYVNSVSGNRVVLSADSVNGPVYAAMNMSNLTEIGGSPAPAPVPAPAQSGAIGVGSRVTMNNWVDYSGTKLAKTRDFYFVGELNGNRAVLHADSANGPVYAAVNISNLRKV